MYKASTSELKHEEVVHISIGWDTMDYLPNKPDKLDVAWCTHFWDVEAKPFEQLVPDFEKAFQESGGYWLLNETETP